MPNVWLSILLFWAEEEGEQQIWWCDFISTAKMSSSTRRYSLLTWNEITDTPFYFEGNIISFGDEEHRRGDWCWNKLWTWSECSSFNMNNNAISQETSGLLCIIHPGQFSAWMDNKEKRTPNWITCRKPSKSNNSIFIRFPSLTHLGLKLPLVVSRLSTKFSCNQSKSWKDRFSTLVPYNNRPQIAFRLLHFYSPFDGRSHLIMWSKPGLCCATLFTSRFMQINWRGGQFVKLIVLVLLLPNHPLGGFRFTDEKTPAVVG